MCYLITSDVIWSSNDFVILVTPFTTWELSAMKWDLFLGILCKRKVVYLQSYLQNFSRNFSFLHWSVYCNKLLLNEIHSNYCKRVCLFYAKFSLDNFDFSSDFYACDFLRFALSKIRSQSQFQAAELNGRKFNTKSQMKSAPKPVPFFNFKS